MPTIHFPIREMTRNELCDAVKLLFILGGGTTDQAKISASTVTWRYIVKQMVGGVHVDAQPPPLLGCATAVEDLPDGHFHFSLARPNDEPFVLCLSIPHNDNINFG